MNIHWRVTTTALNLRVLFSLHHETCQKNVAEKNPQWKLLRSKEICSRWKKWLVRASHEEGTGPVFLGLQQGQDKLKKKTQAALEVKWRGSQSTAAGRSPHYSEVTQKNMLQNRGHVVGFKPTAMTACCFVLKGPGITAEFPRVFRSLFMHHERQHGSCQQVPRLVTDCKLHISRSFPGKETFAVDFKEGRREENWGEYARDMAVILGKHTNPESPPITAVKD